MSTEDLVDESSTVLDHEEELVADDGTGDTMEDPVSENDVPLWFPHVTSLSFLARRSWRPSRRACERWRRRPRS